MANRMQQQYMLNTDVSTSETVLGPCLMNRKMQHACAQVDWEKCSRRFVFEAEIWSKHAGAR
eukprot:2201289-Alexandrium_andersonii.AAC.1